ncbi:hypothetical protein [Siccirubricoccus deserti]|uniref:Calcium-binding protein n=1 Tax=Siccirubricoccus deserti TaxID=2013562 RepID=A0A9X0QZ79_9PROT|nr:hypothetical protein [Siccirubricoccus deserti]MBC4016380.1 hypothetical protein [Siccirubricoccus deserti]
MNLNVLLRGQSNAFLLGAINGGADAMINRVEQLLGFDGVNDTVRLEFASDSSGGNTVFSGTSFLTDWIGTQGNGWTVAELEQSLLDYINTLPAAQKAEPTAVVWLHSEYDSGFGDLTPAEWESAVRYDAALVRAAFGQSAAALPYLFVSAIPYDQGTGTGHQAIRIGMEELAADPGFNAHIAARALDTDMSFDNWDGNAATQEYGGSHMSNADGLQTGERLALALAQQWAQYAKPGSPVAQAGGQVDDIGPQVIQANAVGTNQLALTVAFDAASALQALDPDAARGVGWTVIGAGGPSTAVDATRATLTGANTLVLDFAEALPAGGRLYYGWGNGRLAGADDSGRGNAVYDEHGMPIWVAAHGLAVGGLGAAAAPALPTAGGGAMPAAIFGMPGAAWDQAGLVWTGSHDYAGTTYQTYGAKTVWAGVDTMALAPAAWNANWSGILAVDNIPNANLDLSAAGGNPLDLLLVGARGGTVTLGNGNDGLVWVAHSNAPGHGATLVVNTGAGNDRVEVTAVGLSQLADGNRFDNGGLYDPDYDGRYSVAEVHLGGGRDLVNVTGLAKLVAFTGDALATANGGGGGDAFLIGSGGGSFSGGDGGDSYVFVPGSGNSTIADFTRGEDWLTFAGIPAGALAITAATQDGVAGTLVTFDAAGHSVFLAGVGGLNGSDMVFF